jgi:hypothetical protein
LEWVWNKEKWGLRWRDKEGIVGEIGELFDRIGVVRERMIGGSSAVILPESDRK